MTTCGDLSFVTAVPKQFAAPRTLAIHHHCDCSYVGVYCVLYMVDLISKKIVSMQLDRLLP